MTTNYTTTDLQHLVQLGHNILKEYDGIKTYRFALPALARDLERAKQKGDLEVVEIIEAEMDALCETFPADFIPRNSLYPYDMYTDDDGNDWFYVCGRTFFGNDIEICGVTLPYGNGRGTDDGWEPDGWVTVYEQGLVTFA